MNTPKNSKSEINCQEQATYASHEAERNSLINSLKAKKELNDLQYNENPNVLKEKILELIHSCNFDLPTYGAVLMSAFTDLLIDKVDCEHWDAVFDSFYEVGKEDLLYKKEKLERK